MAKCDLNAVIQIAENEIGYLEKKSNSQLDHKTANAGSKNYTKYNRDYNAWGGGGAQPMEWCAAFVSWCFVHAYGLEAAKMLLCGGLHHYTPTGANRFKKKGQYIKRGAGTPKRGDVIYFFSSSKGRIGHVGLVYKVSSTRVYTIEGNTSAGNTLITNGGGAAYKSYSLTSTYIDGYGRPNYAAIEAETGDTVALDLGDRLLTNGCRGDDVKELQEALISLGYDLGRWGADGDFGDATEIAVEKFQRDHGCTPDGEFGPISFAALQTALTDQEHAAQKGGKVRIVNGNCWVRSEPDKVLPDTRLGVVTAGTVLEYRGEKSPGGWLAVRYENRDAWVSGKYSKLED